VLVLLLAWHSGEDTEPPADLDDAAVNETGDAAGGDDGEGDDGEASAAVTDTDAIAAPAIIPIPRRLEVGTGHLHLTDRTRITTAAAGRAEAELLARSLRPATGLPLTVSGDQPRPGDIALTLTDRGPAEGYDLEVDASGVRLSAPSRAGLFYGSQTLRQMLPASIERSTATRPPAEGWRLPMVTIRDAPRYPWRGAMLDIARHFFDAGEITTYIDQLASYKINRLHLHLTDDQGWRIEIPGWPDLTAVGGRTDIDGGAGGWLTADDYRTITEHAAARHMTVVPEVDVPGHVTAALASYGELNPSGQPAPLGGLTTYGRSSLDPGLAATARFVTDVFTELAAMTPGPYVHLGGDEAFATSPEGYDTVVAQAVDAIRAGGKTPVGWEEIIEAEPDGEFIVQHWLDPLKAVRSARRGAQVIMSPAGRAYLDQKYDAGTVLGLDWAGLVEVDTAYTWDPSAIGVDPGAVVGVEAPLWTETVAEPDDLEHLAFPRVLGVAEIGWSDRRDRALADYLRRLAAHGPRMDAQAINFHRSPLVDWPRS
jgi:hexosaminidase